MISKHLQRELHLCKSLTFVGIHKTRFSVLCFKRERNDTLCFMCLHFNRKGKVPRLTHVSKILKDDFEYLTVEVLF